MFTFVNTSNKYMYSKQQDTTHFFNRIVEFIFNEVNGNKSNFFKKNLFNYIHI